MGGGGGGGEELWSRCDRATLNELLLNKLLRNYMFRVANV